jgi:hypothetical protein
MTPIELLNHRADNYPEISMTLQEWIDLFNEIWTLPPAEQLQYEELEFNRVYMGKMVLVAEGPST